MLSSIDPNIAGYVFWGLLVILIAKKGLRSALSIIKTFAIILVAVILFAEGIFYPVAIIALLVYFVMEMRKLKNRL